VIGSLGQLHPRAAQAYAKLWSVGELAKQDILVADIDLELLLKAVPPRHLSKPLSPFPAALRDIAVIVPDDTTAEQVQSELRAAGGDLLADVQLFDLYRGDSIPTGTKSLAYHLVYQAFDRTLTEKEIETAHKKVENRVRHVLKGSIRGQE
jgi:phenylalanyl-tRNA synthetase beta chain